MRDTVIVAFYGGPGAGKSTLAAELFGWMKRERRNVEYVAEYAKDLTWDQSMPVLDDQVAVFGEQFHRFYRLYGQVDWIVTDSPLILQLYYFDQSLRKLRESTYKTSGFTDAFARAILASARIFPTIMIKAERGDRKFVQAGRNQTEDESRAIDDELCRMMDENGVLVAGSASTLEEVLSIINVDLKERPW